MAADVERYMLLGEGAFARTFSLVRTDAGPGAQPIAAAKIFDGISVASIRMHFDRERAALRELSSGEDGHGCLIRYLRSYIDSATDQGIIFLELGPDFTIAARLPVLVLVVLIPPCVTGASRGGDRVPRVRRL